MQSRTAGLGGSGQSQVGLLSEEGALARGGGGVCGFCAVSSVKGGVVPNQGLVFTKLALLVKLCTNRGDW